MEMASQAVTQSHEYHKQARDGYSDVHSRHYDKVRAGYPDEAFLRFRRAFGDKSGLNIVELGCGTGIFTRGLLARPESAGETIAELRAIEPVEGMRGIFNETVKDAKRVPRGAEPGTFESTGVEDGWADGIVIATAFHWCVDFDGALREFRRILKPDGIVFLVWNLVAGKRTKWTSQLCQLPQKYAGNDPSVQHEPTAFRRVFDSPLFAPNFELAEEEVVIEHGVPATTAGVVEHVYSWSSIAPLDAAGKEEVRKEVEGIVERGKEEEMGLEWIDREKGILDYPHDSLVVVFKRKRGEGI